MRGDILYYTYLCETYSGEKVEITVCANSEAHAKERLSEYRVSKGELHYVCKLLDVSAKGKEKFYSNPNNSGLGLFVALMGSAMGADIIRQYGQNKNYLSALHDVETIRLLKEN